MNHKLFIISTTIAFLAGCFFVYAVISRAPIFQKLPTSEAVSIKSEETLSAMPKPASNNLKQQSAATSSPAQPDEKPLLATYSIGFFGDIMLDRDVRTAIDRKGFEHFFEESANLLSKADVNIANLEGPVADMKSVSVGAKMESLQHYTFVFDPKTLPTLKEKNFSTFFLGNNHILNFGSEGLNQTKENLSRHGISFFGEPGVQTYMAQEKNNIQYALIGYNEFEKGSKEKALAWVSEAEGKNQVVVVFTHWGIEYENIPSSKQKELAHQLVDAGADVIIGTHPHVVQSIEKYNGKVIFYSLGNFIFDQFFSPETKTGLSVVMHIDSSTRELRYDLNMFSIDGSFRIKPLPGEKIKAELSKLSEFSVVSKDEKELIKTGTIR